MNVVKVLLHVAPPCSSFSKARCREGHLRSGILHTCQVLMICGHVMQKRSALATSFCDGAVNCCELVSPPKLCVCVCVLENPWTSWAWQMVEALALRRMPTVSFRRTDFCQWGTPWRKATGLMSVHLDYQAASRVCCGKPGICSRTGKAHQVLKGQRADGVFWTLIAEPYPKIWCTCLARCVARSIQRLQCAHVNAVLQRLM